MKSDFDKQNKGYLELEDKIEEPGLYQIVLHNDDFTTMEFVMEILEKIFFMDRRKAAEVMMEAHQGGKAVCGVFTKDIAESKIEQVSELAKKEEHPLFCSMEAA
ncbi:MAG TPA: ATP-dependent Clp protease adapter ClpS [Gammaproteobacteria bacterium]|nr:ATP-dependent Clp protease adapter ClpS [Gammaproteobacteria bacterium]